MEFTKPSSTITAAALAGLGTTFIWEVVMQVMPDLVIRPSLVTLSGTLVIAVFGYLKKEKVLGNA